MFSSLISVLAPPLCIACAGDAGRAAPLCRQCRAELMRTAVGDSFTVMAASAASATGASEWAPFAYDGPAGALVRALKFGGRIQLADVMAAHLATNAPPDLLAGALVPVPIHDTHRRRRGLSHAHVLAEALGRRAGLPVVDCLERIGDPRPQVGRGRRDRKAGLAGAIVLRADPPERAVVVDDVVTTGATIAACTQVLRAAGCAEIAAIAYARTLGR